MSSTQPNNDITNSKQNVVYANISNQQPHIINQPNVIINNQPHILPPPQHPVAQNYYLTYNNLRPERGSQNQLYLVQSSNQQEQPRQQPEAMQMSSHLAQTCVPAQYQQGGYVIRSGNMQQNLPLISVDDVLKAVGGDTTDINVAFGDHISSPAKSTTFNSFKMDNLLDCDICGDKTFGRHYGVISCEGCKGFFKRSIRYNISYVCRNNEECEVHRNTRNKCQACRLKKCLERGMKREAVQLLKLEECTSSTFNDRMSGDPSSAYYSSDTPEISFNTLEGLLTASQSEKQRMENSAGGYLLHFRTRLEIPGTKLSFFLAADAAFFQDDNEPSEANKNISHCHPSCTEAPYRIFDNDNKDSLKHRILDDSNIVSTVISTLDSQLYVLVDWAKRLPSFKELPSADQMCLITHSWMEILLFHIAFISKPFSRGMVALTSEYMIDLRRLSEKVMLALFSDVENELCTYIKNINWSKNEVSIVKAYIIFNPKAHKLMNSAFVQDMRSKLRDILLEHSLLNHPDDDTRWVTLMFVIPNLRIVARDMRHELNLIRMRGEVTFERFLSEMLEYDATGTTSTATAAHLGRPDVATTTTNP